MPISSNTRKAGPFTGTGLVTTYPFNFKVFQAADVYVVRADLTGTESVLVLNTDYTVSLNADQDVSPGGNVVLSSALTSGYTLVITSSIENLQPTDLTNGGGFYPSVITDALDRACIQIQQLQEVSGRSVRVPLSTPTGVQMQLPSPTADRIIGWDNVGTALRNYSLSELATSVAYGAAVSDVFTGTGAQIDFVLSYNPASINNLYVSVGGVVQTPDVDFTWTTGTTLTFTTAPPNGVTVLVRYMQALAQGDVVDNAVTTSKIVDNAVTTSKIVDNAVTNAKLAFDGGAFGFRNKIINGNFSVNQAGYVSGAATPSDKYGHDMWKMGAAGDSYTFSTVNGLTTATIPSGKVLQQIVEGVNLQTGTYVLSWTGTAQGKIGAGSYGASGAVTASITGGTNTTIEFGPGTVTKVQLELGTTATPFEHRPYGLELSLCQRYYQIQFFVAGESSSAASVRSKCSLRPVPMRANPTVVETFIGGINVSAVESTGDLNTLSIQYTFGSSGWWRSSTVTSSARL